MIRMLPTAALFLDWQELLGLGPAWKGEMVLEDTVKADPACAPYRLFRPALSKTPDPVVFPRPRCISLDPVVFPSGGVNISIKFGGEVGQIAGASVEGSYTWSW